MEPPKCETKRLLLLVPPTWPPRLCYLILEGLIASQECTVRAQGKFTAVKEKPTTVTEVFRLGVCGKTTKQEAQFEKHNLNSCYLPPFVLNFHHGRDSVRRCKYIAISIFKITKAKHFSLTFTFREFNQ